MRLNDIQENFKKTILDPAQIGNAAFRDVFRQGAGIGLENRMKVYRNNVVRSLTDTLMSVFPMTKKLVGEEFLTQAARAYVVKNLPAEGCLNLYGMTFPDFLKNYEPAKNLPYLYDMTRLEWLWEAAYYAPDDEPLAPAALTQIPHENLPGLRLSFRASFALIESNYPLDKIVDFCRKEDSQETLDIGKRGAKLMIFRPELTVGIRRLEEGEYAFLKALQENETIEQACVTVSRIDTNFDLSAVLQKYLKLGVFKGYSYEGPDRKDK